MGLLRKYLVENFGLTDCVVRIARFRRGGTGPNEKRPEALRSRPRLELA
jgi:hypothetical protein